MTSNEKLWKRTEFSVFQLNIEVTMISPREYIHHCERNPIHDVIALAVAVGTLVVVVEVVGVGRQP